MLVNKIINKKSFKFIGKNSQDTDGCNDFIVAEWAAFFGPFAADTGLR